MKKNNKEQEKILADFPEIFDLAIQSKKAANLLLRDFNSRNIKLGELAPSKRLMLFFMAKIIKTYSAILILCREGYGQDSYALLRGLLETLISIKYIFSDALSADEKAVRFVEYKWVILKRYSQEYEEGSLIQNKFSEFKKKYNIISDKALITWSGKSVRDMAKHCGVNLLDEYDFGFRIYSRFSHPSIIGDKEYLRYENDVLRFSFFLDSSGIILSLKKATLYLIEFLFIFNKSFNIQGDLQLSKLQGAVDKIFQMEKYSEQKNIGNPADNFNKEKASQVSVQFDIVLEE